MTGTAFPRLATLERPLQRSLQRSAESSPLRRSKEIPMWDIDWDEDDEQYTHEVYDGVRRYRTVAAPGAQVHEVASAFARWVVSEEPGIPGIDTVVRIRIRATGATAYFAFDAAGTVTSVPPEEFHEF